MPEHYDNVPVLLYRMFHGTCANLQGITVWVTLTRYTSPYIQLSTTTSILMCVHCRNRKFYTTRFITLCNMRRKLGYRKFHKINTMQIFCLSDNFITSPYVIMICTVCCNSAHLQIFASSPCLLCYPHKKYSRGRSPGGPKLPNMQLG